MIKKWDRGRVDCAIWRYVLAAGCVAALIAWGSRASAASLAFEEAPVTDAVAQIDKTFHVSVEIKPGVDADGAVSFVVDDIDEPGGRLQAIDMLANALNADYQKVFVVKSVTDDSVPVAPAIDVDAPVVFSDKVASPEDAIAMVAAIDDARVQFFNEVHGSLVVTDKEMTAAEAAKELARQTHTSWRTVYEIIPRHHGLVANGSKVIGYTDGGQPITEMAVQSFRMPRPLPSEPDATAADKAGSDKNADKTASSNGNGNADEDLYNDPNATYSALSQWGYGGSSLQVNPFASFGSQSPPPGVAYVPNAMTVINGQIVLQPPSSAPSYGPPFLIR